ncbi:MAG: AI-2E family transporter, partial [Chthoniobacterales bacterium]
MTKYPTQWQRKMMWASLTALFIVVLFGIVGTVVWLGANVVAFLQPILIPVAIGVILAYLLDPVVTYLAQRGFGRTKATLCIFAIAFIALGGLFTWIIPLISVQSASLARQLPTFTVHVRDHVVDLMYRYESTFGLTGKKGEEGSTGIVNWLLAGPTPTPAQPIPTPVPHATPLPGNGEVIGPAPAKFTSADRQRIQDWVQKQLPALEKQLPDLIAKLWLLVKTSVGGFIGVTGFLLSLVMVPIYAFFLLKERPAIQRRWKEYLPLRASPL